MPSLPFKTFPAESPYYEKGNEGHNNGIKLNVILLLLAAVFTFIIVAVLLKLHLSERPIVTPLEEDDFEPMVSVEETSRDSCPFNPSYD